MREEGLEYAEAFAQVSAIRPSVSPNRGFAQQLEWCRRNGCQENLRDADGGYYHDLPDFARLFAEVHRCRRSRCFTGVGGSRGSRSW